MIQKLEMGHFLVPPPRDALPLGRARTRSPTCLEIPQVQRLCGRMERSTYCTMLGRNR